MIVIESTANGASSVAERTRVAQRLRRRGHAVCILSESLTDPLEPWQRYEAAPFLTDAEDIGDATALLILGAESLTEACCEPWLGIPLAEDAKVVATGWFASEADRESAHRRLEFALSRKVDIVNLTARFPRSLSGGGMVVPAAVPVHRAISRPMRSQRPGPQGDPILRLLVSIPGELFGDPTTLASMAELDNLPLLKLSILTDATGKQLLNASRHHAIAAYAPQDIGPMALADQVDIAAFFGPGIEGGYYADLTLDLLWSGGITIDCTERSELAATGAPVLKGPAHLAGLANYLQHTVLPYCETVRKRVAQSDWLRGTDIGWLEDALGLSRPGEAHEPSRPRRAIFLPTNGVGLGHAQRSVRIAQAMDARDACAFAVFPSCTGTVARLGFPCLPLVQRADLQGVDHSGDVINYLRLSEATQPGDVLVFDGSAIFASVYRAILERRLRGIWVRRGLWKAGRSATVNFTRISAFRKIIVPGEAFEELNAPLSFGDNVHPVGPVVQGLGQATDSADLRGRIARHFRIDFDTMIVSLLGAGVVADRTAQLQSLSMMAERRSSTLHLIVVWPGGRIPPAQFGWTRTRVVQTQNVPDLCRAADIVVTAAGYNSFNEMMYHRIPAIFLAQTGTALDDQERRARAASDRGLAITVGPSDLVRLRLELTACLDEGKAATLRSALGSASFPEIGNRSAAAIIDAELRA